jgi:uncharacterized heparinase superfamily protein
MSTATLQKPLTTDRQKELLRVLNDSFTAFAKRGQQYYALDGMSTHHIVVHAIQDFTTLREFWPTELVEKGYGARVVYGMQDDTLSKVQSAVRESLKQLAEKGWVEQAGNEHERRWRLVKKKDVITKKDALDPSGKKIGHYEKINDGEWNLHLSK